jgi:hypothetical protein
MLKLSHVMGLTPASRDRTLRPGPLQTSRSLGKPCSTAAITVAATLILSSCAAGRPAAVAMTIHVAHLLVSPTAVHAIPSDPANVR